MTEKNKKKVESDHILSRKLMNYFKTADPDDDSEGELSKRVRYLKKEEGGVEIMCEVSDRIMERGRKFGEEQLLCKQIGKNLARGMSIAEIAEVLDEPERRIREIMESEALK